MRALEEARKDEGLPPLKYHGKWGFKRFYGALNSRKGAVRARLV